MPSLRKILRRRWWEQDQRCLWCGRWVWMMGMVTRRDATARLWHLTGAKPTKREVNRARATAEHLVPKSLGGTNRVSNIVCACQACNVTRGADMASMQPVPGILSNLPIEVQHRVLRLPSEFGRLGRSDAQPSRGKENHIISGC